MGSGLIALLRATRPAKDGMELKQNWDLGGRSVGIRQRAAGFLAAYCLCPLPDPLLEYENNQAERAISTGKLHALPRFHIRPIDVVVFHGSSGRNSFEAGFPLRCLQRLSIPYIATLHCGWRHNRSTRDTFTPVLSY